LCLLNEELFMPSPTNPAPVYQRYAGIDIAYKTFTLALFEPKGKVVNEVQPFEQTEVGFAKLVKKLLSSKLLPKQVMVVLEATSTYWINLAVYLYGQGFAVYVVNPAQAHHFAQALSQRSKNDQLDAAMLAKLGQALQSELTAWSPPPQIYHELQQRLNQRQSLLGMRLQLENQLHALKAGSVVVKEVASRQQALIDHLKAQILTVETEIEELFKAESEWAASVALLQTIPGIGFLTACWLVVTTLNFSTCERPEELVSYIGLAPREFTSGTSLRGRATIGRAGQSVVRGLLYLATLSAARFNPAIKLFYERLIGGGKANKLVRCACARKLVHLIFGVIKSGKAFDPTYHLKAAKAETL
jgi:transposase